MIQILYIKTQCPFCHKITSISVPADKWKAFQYGALVQVAFPDMKPEEREQILTGICPDCWNSVVKSEPEKN
jgi:hypothetical protein